MIISLSNYLSAQFREFLIEEKKINSVNFLTNYIHNQIFEDKIKENIALWLSADRIIAENNSKISEWRDCSINNILAIQEIKSRMPELVRDGINGLPSVKFNGDVRFGEEDILYLTYDSRITTASNFEDNSKRTLSIVFYCENVSRRQVIFEAGGVESGYLIYIEPPDNIYFGMFKDYSKAYVKQKIAPGVHLAQLEYDGQRMRGILNGKATDYKNFKGITVDKNRTGIGGSATGTRFLNLSFGATYGYHFSGLISEIIILNDCSSSSSSKVIYDYLDSKYRIYGKYPYNWNKSIEDESDDLSNSDNSLRINYENGFPYINIILDKSANCKIETYDLSGRPIELIYEGELKADLEYRLHLNHSLYNSGTYFVRLSGDKSDLTNIFSVTR